MNKFSTNTQSKEEFKMNDIFEKYQHNIDLDLIGNPSIFDEMILLFSRSNANDLIRYFFKNHVVGDPSDLTKRELTSAISMFIRYRVKEAEMNMISHIQNIKKVNGRHANVVLKDLFFSQIPKITKYGDKIGVFYWYPEEKLYHLSLNYSENLLEQFSDITLNGDVNVLNYINTYLKIPKEVGRVEQKTNNTLREVVRDLSSRIVEMYQWGLSYNRIQKTLTKECIEMGRIPSKVTRLSRLKKSLGNIIEVDTLLPISEIKKVILESQSA